MSKCVTCGKYEAIQFEYGGGLCALCFKERTEADAKKAAAKAADEESRRPPTLRDRFAMAALTGLVRDDGMGIVAVQTLIVGTAYDLADAMLKAKGNANENL